MYVTYSMYAKVISLIITILCYDCLGSAFSRALKTVITKKCLAPENASTSAILLFFFLFVFHLHHHMCPVFWYFHLNSIRTSVTPCSGMTTEDPQMLLWWWLLHLQLIFWRQCFLPSLEKTFQNLNQLNTHKQRMKYKWLILTKRTPVIMFTHLAPLLWQY